ncbi:MAG: Uma2 family endonuclease [Chloroflexota bacterium]
MVIARSKLSLEEFLQLPEEVPSLEYEDGRITQKVSPKLKHSALQTQLAILIQQFADQFDLGMVFIEARTTFAGTSRVPDVAFYRKGRPPVDDNGEVANDVFVPPDLAIEIRSPGQSLQAQLRRCRAYVSQGVALALAVDPDHHRLWVFQANGLEMELGHDQPIDFGKVLPGLTLTPRAIFAKLRPRS